MIIICFTGFLCKILYVNFSIILILPHWYLDTENPFLFCQSNIHIFFNFFQLSFYSAYDLMLLYIVLRVKGVCECWCMFTLCGVKCVSECGCMFTQFGGEECDWVLVHVHTIWGWRVCVSADAYSYCMGVKNVIECWWMFTLCGGEGYVWVLVHVHTVWSKEYE